jgi:hypothetical protein
MALLRRLLSRGFTSMTESRRFTVYDNSDAWMNYKLLIGAVVPRPIAWVSCCQRPLIYR